MARPLDSPEKSGPPTCPRTLDVVPTPRGGHPIENTRLRSGTGHVTCDDLIEKFHRLLALKDWDGATKAMSSFGELVETVRRPKEKPRHRGVEPPAALPLVVRAALRLMECHRPTRRPPPTRPDRPRAGPAQTYAPPQPHPPRFLHTTREEWRDLLFLSYEFHAKRERWRSC